MAELTIRWQWNPQTGKQDLVVGLRGDEDALPHEHEQRHRELVERLIQQGIISAADAGQVVVTRTAASATEDTPQTTPEAISSPVPEQGSST